MLLGWKPDAPDDRDFRFEDALVRLGARVSEGDPDLRRFLPPIRNQIAQNCVGHAVMAGVFARAAILGHSIAWPSTFFPYTLARLLESPPRDPNDATPVELVDRGSSFRLMFKACARKEDDEASGFGLVAEERWPEALENVNTIPPEDVFRAGENATIVAYHRLPDGIARIDAMIEALRLGLLPVTSFLVDDDFANLSSSGIYARPGGAVMGGHALLVCGYDHASRAFVIRNSWGTSWADEGYGMVHVDFLRDHSYDSWVTEIAPEVVQ